MQGIVKVTTILQNPDGVISKELRAEWEPGKETDTCLQVLAALKANGGIVRLIDDGEVEYTPINMQRVHHIEIGVGKVQLPGGGSIIHP
jgi:hypothetical protein